MLEKSLRKMFPKWLKKPEKAKASQKRDPQLETPAILPATATSAADSTAASISVAAVTLAGERREDHLRQPEPKQDTGSVTPPSIFNFGAWFMVDPVKSSLLIGLTFLSWLATYTGMLELIQANTGSLDVFSRVAIGFSVVMLQLMILYLLDSVHSHATPGWLKPVFIFGYAFLTLISVGFGFGFYWKYLEARTEATRSAESAVSQVQVSLQVGQSRLEQLQDTFAQLAVLSKKKSDQERDQGNTCPNSKPGSGPRMRLRDEDSQKFGYAAEYITGRVGGVKTDLAALNGDLQKVITRDAATVGADGTRNEFLRDLGRRLDLTIARFNVLASDPQIRQFRDSMAQRAGTTVFPSGTGNATFSCPDTQMQTALNGVVRAIDDIPVIKNPKINAVEGSEAIVEAFRRLAATLMSLPTLKLPPSPEELRKQRSEAISAGKAGAEVANVEPGLSGRDYIPLSAAAFVDLCILLISLNRRRDQFDEFHRSVAVARSGQIGTTMLEIFEAHQSEVSQEMLEIFHQAEFEFNRDYYLAVPLIKGSKEADHLAQIQAKEIEIAQSRMAALDERIGIHEHELQRRTADMTEAERMKKQIMDYINGLQNHRNLLQQNQRQLMLAHRQQPAEHQNAIVQQLSGIEQKITGYSSQIGLFEKELAGVNQLLTGTGKLVQESKRELTTLKDKKSQLREEEQNQLKKRIEVESEVELSKEARFLSNLCVNLEANSILNLAGVWPTQKQVRDKLKHDRSRFYHPERNYRVYRFRKVADTQSQMVLDLIMEAAKRARERGELGRKPGAVAEAAQAARLELERERADIEQRRLELAAERARTEQQIGQINTTLQGMLGVIQAKDAEQDKRHQTLEQKLGDLDRKVQHPGPHRDDNATDINFTELGKTHRTKQAEPAEMEKNEQLRRKFAEALSVEKPNDLRGFAAEGEEVHGNMDEIGRQILQQLGGGAVAATGAAVSREAPLHGIGAAASAKGKSLLGWLTGDGKRRRGEVDKALPAVVTAPLPPVIVAPPAAEPMVAASRSTDVDARDKVNFSAAPRPAEKAEVAPVAPVIAAAPLPPLVAEPREPQRVERRIEPVFEPRIEPRMEPVVAVRIEPPVAEPAMVAEGPDVAPQRAADPKKMASITGRLAKLAEEQHLHDRGHKAAVYEDREPPIAIAPAPAQAEPGVRLTEPVDVIASVVLNQDPAGAGADPLVRDVADDYDEPSEHVDFGEGPPPHYHGQRVGSLEDMSEEIRTQSIAKKFAPSTKEH